MSGSRPCRRWAPRSRRVRAGSGSSCPGPRRGCGHHPCALAWGWQGRTGLPAPRRKGVGVGAVWGGTSPSHPGGALCGAISAKGPESDPPQRLFTTGCRRQRGGLQDPCGLASRRTPIQAPHVVLLPPLPGVRGSFPPTPGSEAWDRVPGSGALRAAQGARRCPGAARAGTGCADDP